jgi:hypothetical protein
MLSHHLPGHEEGAHTGIFETKKAFSELETTKIHENYQNSLKNYRLSGFFVKIRQFYTVTCKAKYVEETS